ncbi:MAG: MotA/TolQ/ExbB proton channel family protein, partial [Bacteroidales bacterium]|nr:MotA/TolQ/ExbB proton channel family protein [Bacteroidales bacterium]
MKKVIALMSIVGLLTFANFNDVKAQDQPAAEATEQVAEATDEAVVEEAVPVEEAAAANNEEKTKTFHQMLKEKYIQGGAGWMTPVLLCLIFGMALIIERILYLNMATTNVKKLLEGIEDNVKGGNYEGAKELCRNTRGPVASIFYQGLDRVDQGLENVEKAVTSYGGVQMARLE